MAGAQKQYELLFKLAAQLAPNFNGTFKKAIETQKKLQNSINGVNSLQSKIDGYTKNSKYKRTEIIWRRCKRRSRKREILRDS